MDPSGMLIWMSIIQCSRWLRRTVMACPGCFPGNAGVGATMTARPGRSRGGEPPMPPRPVQIVLLATRTWPTAGRLGHPLAHRLATARETARHVPENIRARTRHPVGNRLATVLLASDATSKRHRAKPGHDTKPSNRTRGRCGRRGRISAPFVRGLDRPAALAGELGGPVDNGLPYSQRSETYRRVSARCRSSFNRWSSLYRDRHRPPRTPR
jgi:hypothetical protein